MKVHAWHGWNAYGRAYLQQVWCIIQLTWLLMRHYIDVLYLKVCFTLFGHYFRCVRFLCSCWNNTGKGEGLLFICVPTGRFCLLTMVRLVGLPVNSICIQWCDFVRAHAMLNVNSGCISVTRFQVQVSKSWSSLVGVLSLTDVTRVVSLGWGQEPMSKSQCSRLKYIVTYNVVFFSCSKYQVMYAMMSTAAMLS